MKLMKSIFCGVVCFAFACLIGTSCSKKAAEEQQAKTETSAASIEKDGGVSVIVEISMPEILGALAGVNSITKQFKDAMSEARYQQRAGSQETFFDLFCAAYTKDGSPLACLFLEIMRDRIDMDMPDDQVKAIVREEINSAAENSFDVLRARIDRFGVTQPNIRKAGNGRLFIELPGVKEPERIKKLLQSSANLEFWETYTLNEIGSYEALQPLFGLFETFGDRYSPVIGTANVADTAKINETLNQIARDLPRDARFAWEVKPVDETGQYFRLIALRAAGRRGPALEGDAITDARAEESGYYNGNGEVILKMNASGARRWEEITMRNIGKNIAIVLDGEVYSYPMVQSAITGGICTITGNFTMDEAKDLANTLKSGKMSAPIRVFYMEVIEPAQ